MPTTLTSFGPFTSGEHLKDDQKAIASKRRPVSHSDRGETSGHAAITATAQVNANPELLLVGSEIRRRNSATHGLALLT